MLNLLRVKYNQILKAGDLLKGRVPARRGKKIREEGIWGENKIHCINI